MSVYSFNGFTPVVKKSSFIHPKASVTGNVIIGENVYIGPGAAIRGDWGQIIIEDGCNVQENCTIHMFPGTTVKLQKGCPYRTRSHHTWRNFRRKLSNRYEQCCDG